MSHLLQAKKPATQPPMLCIVGSPGTGKTSLGGLFPSPIFVQAENSAATFESWDDDVQPVLLPALPKQDQQARAEIKDRVITPHETLLAQLRELATAEHDFKTLVIDSITSLSSLYEEALAIKYDVPTVADAAGGFHKGFIELAGLHAELLHACDVIRKRRGMAIVFLAHTGIEKIKSSPDEASEYAVYSINMNQKSSALYVAQCDAVLYLTKERIIVGTESNKKGQVTKYGRAIESGDRKIITSGDGRMGYIAAKNRYNMPPEIPLPMGENPLLQWIKHFSGRTTTTTNNTTSKEGE